MSTSKLKIGDIIYIDHKNIDGKFTGHPLVVTHFEDEMLRAVDQRAIFAAFTLSDAKSTYSKTLMKDLSKEELKKVYIPKEINPSPKNKDGVMQIDVLNLFSRDVLPRDVKGSIPEEYVLKAIAMFEVWEEAKKAKFNILNLPEVKHFIDEENVLNKI